ncbi:MAG TPA: prephenate dehydratase domain-containing protein [Burkholderiales bacterium]|nr:prephenate dehydratase domain-containing protein [Burkholderiales bacterium]
MLVTKSMSVGTLGSAATFAGEATSRMRERHPEFNEPVYFPSMDDCWRALSEDTVEVAIVGVERTGQPHHGHPVITCGFHVIAELSQPLQCSLYVKPGTQKSRIRKITGHGSIHQCAAYLDREFPGVPREVHSLNSVAAARDVMAGDGTMAVVGSQSLPRMLSGLEVMAADIDEGAVANWWAVSKQPRFSDEPDALVIASRCGGDGKLGKIVAAVERNGYTLRTAAAFPVNQGVSIYDYLLIFDGKGRRSTVEHAIARFDGARLAGAFTHHRSL